MHLVLAGRALGEDQERPVGAARARAEPREIHGVRAEQRVRERHVGGWAVVGGRHRAQQVEAQQDLGPRVEPAHPHAPEPHAAVPERERRRVEAGMRPRQHREVAGRALPLGDRRSHLARDELGLVARGLERAVVDLARDRPVCDQALVVAAPRLQALRVVEADEPVRGIEDALPRPVVAAQHDGGGARKGVEEAEQVLDLGAAEPVDALVVVPHHREVPAPPAQQLHQLELHVVRVLELVHQHVAVALSQLAPHVRPLAEQPQRERNLCAEVHAPMPEQEALIEGVGMRLLELRRCAVATLRIVACLARERLCELEVVLGRDVLVARPVEERDQRAQVRVGRAERAVAGERKVHHALAQEDQDLGRRHHRELGCEPELDRALEPVGGEQVHAGLHLGRGLVRERERQDLLGAGALGGDQPSDAPRDHLRLAGAGAGHDQERAVAVGHRRALLRTEPAQDVLGGRGRGGFGRERHVRAPGGRRSKGA